MVAPRKAPHVQWVVADNPTATDHQQLALGMSMDDPRSKLTMFAILNAIVVLIPWLWMTIPSEKQPWLPRLLTSPDPRTSRAGGM